MKRLITLSALSLWVLASPAPVGAERERFETPRNGLNLGVWRITNDPTTRHWANYHNTQCWSPDGRYLCYTHYGFDVVRDRRVEQTTVHVVDLRKDEDRLVDGGHSPRWANRHNWLFYVHEDRTAGPPFRGGTLLERVARERLRPANCHKFLP